MQHYSNYGFILIGALIEKTRGMNYEDYVRKNVFEPSGMASMDSLPESVSVPGCLVDCVNQGRKLVPNTCLLPWRGTSATGGLTRLLAISGA